MFSHDAAHMSLIVRKPVIGVSTRSHTNQAVRPHNMARGLKFRIQEVEGLCYQCSKNKGTDQLRGYGEADLHMQKAGFLTTRLMITVFLLS